MWLYDRDSFRFLDVNLAAMQQYGYSKEEFLEMTILDIRPEEEVEKVKKAVNRAHSTDQINSFNGEYIHLKKSGDEILVEIHSSEIQYGNKKARIVLARDVTERRKEEERLKLLESVITNSTETVIIFEAKPTDTHTGGFYM